MRHISKIQLAVDLTDVSGDPDTFVPAGTWLRVTSCEDGYFMVVLPDGLGETSVYVEECIVP